MTRARLKSSSEDGFPGDLGSGFHAGSGGSGNPGDIGSGSPGGSGGDPGLVDDDVNEDCDLGDGVMGYWCQPTGECIVRAEQASCIHVSRRA